MIERISKVSGFIVEVPGHAFNRNDFGAMRDMEYAKQIIPGWEIFRFSSHTAYRNEDILGAQAPYIYPIVVRRSGNRALIVSTTRRAVDEIIAKELNRVFGRELIKVKINVDQMVRGIIARPAEYALSHLHALLSFGSELKSASFYGDDVGGARFVQSNISLMNFTSCGLKKLNTEHEVIKIGYDGYLSFYFRGGGSVSAVEAVLEYLSREAYLPERILT